MFKNKTIEKRVMVVVRTAIAQAQKAFEEEVEFLEKELEDALRNARESHDQKKLTAESKAVKDVFSKIL